MENVKSMNDVVNSLNESSLSCLYGNEPSVLEFQKERYLKLVGDFFNFSVEKDVFLFSSPGRTEIGGNHTDHNYGKVLAGAVNLDNIAIAAKNDSEIIRIKSAGYSDIVVDLSMLNPIGTEQFTSSALVRGICYRLKSLGYLIGGFDACIDSGVPKGSGLSSSASFEVLIGVIISELFNGGTINPLENAMVGQYAENNFFGKPCGLMDQTACAMGGLISIDFENPGQPIVHKLDFDFISTGYSLVITDTGGNHADLNDEYAALPREMKAVASALGSKVLRQVDSIQVNEAIPGIRNIVGDRAILRALHFYGENNRVSKQVAALERNDFKSFLNMVVDSGNSSFMYNQNIYPAHNVKEQGVSLALALSEQVLKGWGAWRVHGGGFAGTIQAFVPKELLNEYVSSLEYVFGEGACRILFIRSKGATKL